MLHFRYFFTEIKTQTSSLILFGARQEFFLKKNDRHASHKDFLFIAVEKEKHVFTVVSKTEKSKYSLISFFATLNTLYKLINGWIRKLEGLI